MKLSSIRLNILICAPSPYYIDLYRQFEECLEDEDFVHELCYTRLDTGCIWRFNVIFIDPCWYSSEYSDRVIKYIRQEYPNKVIVICSTKEEIDHFIKNYDLKYFHYFQLAYERNDEIIISKDRLHQVLDLCKNELIENFERNYEYDVALSFAGENRNYVENVAKHLRENKIRVFYDNFEKVNLFGKNIYNHFSEIYHKKSRFVVVFISEHYSKKIWTNHELANAQARALSEKIEYILPARFDNTEIPGLLNTISYIDLNKYTAIEFAELVIEKLTYYCLRM
jgi:hypothetical protein